MTDFPIPVTAWSTIILAALFQWLTFRVIGVRRKDHILLGDGGDHVMNKKIRGQANAAEQIPIALILLGLAEYLLPGLMPMIIAVLLIVGRVMHGVYFTIHGTNFRLRYYGMLLTLIAQSLAIITVAAGLLL